MWIFQEKMLSREEILKIAKLARLKLSPQEVDTFAEQLNGILDFFEVLQECNTENFSPVAQAVKFPPNLRADRVAEFPAQGLLQSSPNEIHEKQIVVKIVFE